MSGDHVSLKKHHRFQLNDRIPL